MRKFLVSLLPILSLTLVSNVNAASLSCSDLTGYWSGTPSGYDFVNLYLNDYYQNSMLSNINFSLKHGQITDGAQAVDGTCQTNPDGTVSATFNYSSYVGTASYVVNLLSPTELNFQGTVFSYPLISGKLIKLPTVKTAP